MPWKAFKRGDEWCVFKLDDNDKPVGDMLGCHPTKAEADDQVAALYVNVEEQDQDAPADVSEIGGSLEDFIDRVRRSFEQSFSVTANALPVGTEPPYWVTDVFPDYAIVRKGDNYWQASFTATGEEIAFEPQSDWQQVKLVFEPVSELDPRPANGDKEAVESVIVSEFKGQFPNVPPAPGVNLAELISGDDDPMFLTVPISRIGEVSRSGLVHDKALADALVAQVNGDRPGGLMGHLRDDERATKHPVSAIHWIGATLDTDTVWAKGYIPRTQVDVREEYRIAKAKGGKVATSVYGRAMREFAGGSREWRARDFDLESIDLAPHKRAALPGSGDFYITHEMSDSDASSVPVSEHGEKTMTTKAEIIAELTPRDLPDALKKAILSEYETANKTQVQIAELSAERDSLQTTVTELTAERDQLKTQVAEFEQAEKDRKAAEEQHEFDLALTGKVSELTDWTTTDEDALKTLNALRKRFKAAVLSELNGDHAPAKVEQVVAELWDNEFSILAEAVRNNLAGPAAFVGGKTPGKVTVDDSPEAIEHARAKFGF